MVMMNLLLCFFVFYLGDLVNLPSVATKQITMETPVDEHQAKDLRMILNLKKDHESRPLWVVGFEIICLYVLCLNISVLLN